MSDSSNSRKKKTGNNSWLPSVGRQYGVAIALVLGTAALSRLSLNLAMMTGTAFFLAFVSKGMRRYRIPKPAASPPPQVGDSQLDIE